MSQCHDVYPPARYEASAAPAVTGTQCHDPVVGYDKEAVELILANAVRKWAEATAPGEDSIIRAAVGTALYYFASGASVSEACEEARSQVLSRLHHPSHQPRDSQLAAAS